MTANSQTRIIILGTSHPIQCGSGESTTEQRTKFTNTVNDICKDFSVKIIIEEMSPLGLANHDVENTLAFDVSGKLDVHHCYVDLLETDKKSLELYIDRFIFFESDNQSRHYKRELLDRHLLNPIRERRWLSKIINTNEFPVLFICGSDHTLNMVDLINLLEYGPVIAFEEFQFSITNPSTRTR